MPINKLYHTWMQPICELWPDKRITQVRNFVWMKIGIFKSRSVSLSKIAGKIPGSATLVSVTKRLSFWLGQGYLTTKEIDPTPLMVHWARGEDEPWCLATNLLDRSQAWKAYSRRMWTEELHGDLKGHGFDLESTMLHNFLKLSRLTLVVAFLYVWLISTGGMIIHQGLRYLVDRHDRRDLSIFQIGFRFIQRRLTNDLSVQIPLCSYL